MKSTILGLATIALVIMGCQQKETGHAVAIDQPPVRHPNTLHFSESQLRLANITTQKVSAHQIGRTITLTGKLVFDENNAEIISSRAAGRVEKLFIKETGTLVRKGEALYSLYSEALLTQQREYLLAKTQFESLGETEPRYESLLKAAERKLLLYGLSKKQIESLAVSNDVQEFITFLSPASGVVTEVNAAEGQYINEGALLFTLQQNEALWVEASLYPDEISLVSLGDEISIRVNGQQGESLKAKVTFLSPEYRPNSRVVILRAAIKNPGGIYQPGMLAEVNLLQHAKQALTLPVDAVIRDAKGSHVYVQTNTLTFEPRLISTGVDDAGQVEITAGLNENDVVAVTGAYLIYSEQVLKNGSNPMEAHTHE